MSRFPGSIRSLTHAAALAVVLSALSACGGGGSETATPTAPASSGPTAPTGPTDPGPAEAVVGVQTPDSVAVVTATNAD